MLIAVTNRAACQTDFLPRVRALCLAGVDCILLREKDLPRDDYLRLAASCAAICRDYGTRLTLHTHIDIALKLGLTSVQLPFPLFKMLCKKPLKRVSIGVSIHSREEAVFAGTHGASYVTAGHIFATACKKGLPGRGLPFLEEVTGAVSIPVYAIGGVTPARVPDIRKTGAAGICVMSPLMKCESPGALVRKYQAALDKGSKKT